MNFELHLPSVLYVLALLGLEIIVFEDIISWLASYDMDEYQIFLWTQFAFIHFSTDYMYVLGFQRNNL